jgi:hypothetical protein
MRALEKMQLARIPVAEIALHLIVISLSPHDRVLPAPMNRGHRPQLSAGTMASLVETSALGRVDFRNLLVTRK